ncbi:uncharacterized protein P884DRAFT_281237 [Thermothelomyces heterothallicus CBS 202.75]|uniref:uncharacterized protein n=1 Tax=Thermothelomyces heterothallicus CBS 202.75 TaxID=1149848 RepID=UPI003742197D
MAAAGNRAVWQDASGVPGAIRSAPPPNYPRRARNLGPGYPVILGCDVAGTVEVVAPGSAAASRFRVGDRVFGFGANRGFQDYVTLEDKLMATIPGDMTYHEPVVPGLCIATSAMSLGAVQVFDYKDPEVTERVAAELDKGECAGVFMAAGLKEGNVAAWKVAAASKQTLKFASSCHIDDLGEVPKGPFLDCWFETTDATFGGYLSEVLAKGAYKVAPQPLVEAIDLRRFIAEKGHEGVKEAINRARGNMEEDQGVSPVKLVVE